MSGGRTEQLAGTFAIEVLTKRLLSGPATFAESWLRFKEGVAASEAAAAAEVSAARRSSEQDIEDDPEREDRAHHAVRTVGAWLKPLLPSMTDEVAALDRAMERLGVHKGWPRRDARFDRTVQLIEEHLRQDKAWIAGERLIVFTEYKTTLDYLAARLRDHYDDDGTRIRVLYGGGDLAHKERDAIKATFNNPADDIRILIATDVASEGLNLQETARLVLHWDIPWNPSRVEQRNGRLDRHGQGRDVLAYHFTSEDDADLRFMGHVVAKINEIREDLGSAGEVFDAAFQRRFSNLEEISEQDLDSAVESTKGQAFVPCEDFAQAIEHARRIADLGEHLDLSPDTLRDTLEVALGIGSSRPRLEGPDARGRMQIRLPIPSRWEPLIDDTLRLEDRGGALPGLIFDPRYFVETVSGRPVFRPKRDTVLLHLGHPVFRHALATLARARFPGGNDDLKASRWTARTGVVPPGTDALILLTVEELAVNELREPVHHWVRTWRVPVAGGVLGRPLPFVPPSEDPGAQAPAGAERVAADLWEDIRPDVERFLRDRAAQLATDIAGHLAAARDEALATERDRFRQRRDEIARERSQNSIAKLEKEYDKLIEQYRQRSLFEEANRAVSERIRVITDELDRRTRLFGEVEQILAREEARTIERVMPRRFTLRGDPRVFPVAVEIRLPEAAR